MGTFLGKVVRVGLNSITPKYTKGWANPANKGMQKFINGTQQDIGNGVIRFQWGLKHKIVKAAYNESLNNYHKLAISSFSDVADLVKVKNRVPRCLHQAMIELSDLMSRGVKV